MPRKPELPAIDQLASTPDLLRIVLDGVTDEEATWKPAPDRWSIAEILEHLSHVEGYGFRNRIEQIVDEDSPTLEVYDQQQYATEGKYSSSDPEESFAHWEEQRETNVEYLRTLPVAAGTRSGHHVKFGVVSVNHLLNEWALHDLGHVRQIIELIRAVRYFPAVGPFQELYQLKP